MEMKKREVPSFNGDEPFEWKTSFEIYFEVYNICENMKI